MEEPKVREKIQEAPIGSKEEAQEPSILSETWSQDAQDELEDFIEQQGIYIRQ